MFTGKKDTDWKIECILNGEQIERLCMGRPIIQLGETKSGIQDKMGPQEISHVKEVFEKFQNTYHFDPELLKKGKV